MVKYFDENRLSVAKVRSPLFSLVQKVVYRCHVLTWDYMHTLSIFLRMDFRILFWGVYYLCFMRTCYNSVSPKAKDKKFFIYVFLILLTKHIYDGKPLINNKYRIWLFLFSNVLFSAY
jgi:hypothetical protein